MTDPSRNGLPLNDIPYHAALTLERLKPFLENVWCAAAARCSASEEPLKKDYASAQDDPRNNSYAAICEESAGVQSTAPTPHSVAQLAARKHEFYLRLEKHWEPLFALLLQLYGERYDFFYHCAQILKTAANACAERSEELTQLDEQRVNAPDWFLSEKLVGGALYVDLFSENLKEARNHVQYFQELGLSYLHLMPLFAVRPGNSDGGYAISNYRSVDPRLGTIDDLRELASSLREAGISLVLDFVFNHTADDHQWARLAQAGDREYQDFYYIFPDRTMPDAYEETLREIFPTVRHGNFTWHDGMQRWVWTTFNSFQWDLNYSNPAVFCAMLGEMLFLANVGVDILRLDAVAFIWKRMGTDCENLPEAHLMLRAFNLLARIASPGLLFKSEAIVHPDEVIKYISPKECQLSYNSTLMALLWESLATRKVALLEETLEHYHKLPEQTAWVNYLRCHDDIGWTFNDEHAAAIGINAFEHRKFLNLFYTGQFEGSFARGIPFQENHRTGDMRISGTMASLAGLERALEENDEKKIDMAIRRMTLLHLVTPVGSTDPKCSGSFSMNSPVSWMKKRNNVSAHSKPRSEFEFSTPRKN